MTMLARLTVGEITIRYGKSWAYMRIKSQTSDDGHFICVYPFRTSGQFNKSFVVGWIGHGCKMEMEAFA